MAKVVLSDLVKKYDQTLAVEGINLDIHDGEFVVLVGPSGCGKSTTLRMVAGLEDISSGYIIIGERVVNFIPPKDRDIAMVFQSYALYPSMSVAENMSFGLRLRKVDKEEIRKQVFRAAEILGIEDLLDRRPRQLSGGQRQRVAMGRAIVRNPEVFLFDEPLSNLDAKLRVKMRTEIKRIHQKLKTTTIYVTHDQIEAMTLADRVVVMNEGKIEQVGPPTELYNRPKTKFVATFIGSPAMNIIPCRIVSSESGLGIRLSEDLVIPIPSDLLARYEGYKDQELLFGIRPEGLSISKDPDRNKSTLMTIRVDVLEPLGAETLLFFRFEDYELCARVAPETALQPEQEIALSVDLDRFLLIDPANDQVI